MKKQSMAAVPPPQEQPDAFEEGALWTLSQVLAVLNEQRDGAYLIERMLKDAPEDKKQVLTDILRPLSAQQSAGETIYNRVEQRVGRHLRERYKAARKAEATP